MLDELNSMLDLAESHFIARRFPEALDQSLRTLQRLMGYPCPDALLTVSELHLPASGLIDHLCSPGCVCEAAVLLALQAVRENDAPLSQGDLLISKCYPILKLCPFDVFCAWFAYSCEPADPAQCDTSIQRALEYWNDDKTALLPRPRLSVQQRQSMLLQIVFNGLFYADVNDVDAVELNSSTPQQCKRAHDIIDSCSEWADSDFSARLRHHIDAISGRHAKSLVDNSKPVSDSNTLAIPQSSSHELTASITSHESRDTLLGKIRAWYLSLIPRIQSMFSRAVQHMPGHHKSRARFFRFALIVLTTFVSWSLLQSIVSALQRSENSFVRSLSNLLVTSWQQAFGSFGRYM